ncbi:MAG: DUF421 domain-containing protein [Acidobacteria bacterium]|nr:DUF421 domain-containing protein [Acidobacteriota bacterium]
MDWIFFNGWTGLLRTLIIGVLAYVSLLILLRIAGKRTLSKMNAFDFVVTIALGSTLATVILSKDVPLLEGALAFAVLIGMQFLITWSSVRTSWVRRVVTGEPHLLLYRGEVLDEPMRGTRITKDEILSAIRNAGLTSLDEVEAVVLETDGSFSVIRRSSDPGDETLEGVAMPDHLEQRLKH